MKSPVSTTIGTRADHILTHQPEVPRNGGLRVQHVIGGKGVGGTRVTLAPMNRRVW